MKSDSDREWLKQPFADILQNRCSKEFRNVHRKAPMLESLFNKVTCFQACNFIKKNLQYRCFPVNITKFLRTVFFIENLRWLLLNLFDCDESCDEEWAYWRLFDGWQNIFINFTRIHSSFVSTITLLDKVYGSKKH